MKRAVTARQQVPAKQAGAAEKAVPAKKAVAPTAVDAVETAAPEQPTKAHRQAAGHHETEPREAADEDRRGPRRR